MNTQPLFTFLLHKLKTGPSELYMARLNGSTNRRCQEEWFSTCSRKELNHWSLACTKLTNHVALQWLELIRE